MNVTRVAIATARTLLLLLCAWLVGCFVYVVVQRFRFPVEIEWMGGGILDHVERVRRGEPIYVAPSERFISLPYTPLYYWLSGAAARVMPVLTACRVVSLVATALNGALIWLLARALGASRFWSTVAVGLFAGAYSLTGFWYDIERCDSVATTLLLGGSVAWMRWKDRGGAAIAGALFAFAFLAKQQTLPCVVWVGASLALARQWKALVRFGVGAVVGGAPVVYYAAINPSFVRYCVTMPARHGIDIDLATGLITEDFGKGFLLFGATVVALGAWLLVLWRGRRGTDADVAPGAMLLATVTSAVGSRLHVGGWSNVLIPWVAFGCVSVAVLAQRFEARLETQVAAMVLAALQLMHLAYDPKVPCPDAQRVIDARIIEDEVRRLETKGDVIVPGRGHLTAHAHFHTAALMDILRGGLDVPADLREALEERKYAAYIVDEMGELTFEAVIHHRSELASLLERNYFLGKRFDDRERPPVIGWTAHPTWVFYPRKTPLTELSDDALDRRMRVEMGLCEARMRQVQAGVTPAEPDEVIEAQAAALTNP